MKIGRWFVLGLTAALIAPASGEGQEPATPVVLTLQEALKRASEHSPQYRRALNSIQMAGPQSRQAWGGFLPDLNLSLGTSQNFRKETQALDFFGNPIENPQTETVYSSGSSQGVSMGLDLFQGGSRFHALGQARAQADVSRRAGERELNAVLAEVQRQFREAQKRRSLLAVEEELLSARQRDLDLTQRLYELASKNRSDLLGTEFEVEAQRAAVRRARGEYDKALLSLRTAMGDRSLRNLDVGETDPEVFDPTTLPIGDLVGRAMSASPTVREAEATTRSSQASLKVQRSSRWPSVSLNTQLYRQSFGLNQSALFDVSPDDFGGNVSLSFSIPVFSRFQTSYQIAEADVTYRNSIESLREAELQVEEAVRARYVDLETAWSTLQEGARGQELAEERLRMVREEYRLANAAFEDLQSAIRTAAESRRTTVEQRYAFAQALVDLHEAAGIVAQEAGLGGPTSEDR